MRILIISNLYPPYYLGGYEIGCKNVADGLIRSGHEVVVLSSPSHVPEGISPQASNQGAIIFRRLQLRFFQPANRNGDHVNHLEAMLSNYNNTVVILETIRDLRPDCVYLFNLVGLGGLAIIDALNSLSVPWVLHLMDRLPHLLQDGFPRNILSLFNAHEGGIYHNGQIISMTRHLINEIQCLTGFNLPGSIEIIPGWVDIAGEFVERDYFRNGKVRFVNAGAVNSSKGIDLIVEAASLLKNSGMSNFKIDIYGDGDLAYYVDLVKRYQVSDFVGFLGSRTQAELIDIYKSSDAFLFPTWDREPFGFAPVEAAAVGCIPIITATCGVAERLVGNVHCIKIERSAVSLSTAMRTFCRHEVDAVGLGRNAQAITREDLGFKNCLALIEDVLKRTAYGKVLREPGWRDINRAYLKHNLALKLIP